MYTGSDHVNNLFGFTGKASFGLAIGCTGKAHFRLDIEWKHVTSQMLYNHFRGVKVHQFPMEKSILLLHVCSNPCKHHYHSRTVATTKDLKVLQIDFAPFLASYC